MVKTASTMKKLGTPVQDFKLTNVDGRLVGLHDFDDQPALPVRSSKAARMVGTT